MKPPLLVSNVANTAFILVVVADDDVVLIGCFTDTVVGYLVNGVPLYSWYAEAGDSYTVEEGVEAVIQVRKLADEVPPTPVNYAATWHPVAEAFEKKAHDNCKGHKDSSGNYHRKSMLFMIDFQ